MNVTIADRYWSEAALWLKAQPDLTVQFETTPQALALTEALIFRTKFKLDRKSLAMMPKLRYAVSATVGFDHIDLEAVKECGVQIAHCPDAHSASTAELTWALVLACARKIHQADKVIHSGVWNRSPLSGIELFGKTYGVMGLGRIGSRVAKIAQGFGMNVVAFDPFREAEWFTERNVARVGLDELFRLANVISLHVPLTSETKNRIHRIQLGLLRPDSILVNTSRGGVIKEQDLVEHLRQDRPGHFGLDVFQNEPLPADSGLLEDFPQLILTPHIGAMTDEAFKAVSMEAAKNLIALIKKVPATGPLPPREEWYLAQE